MKNWRSALIAIMILIICMIGMTVWKLSYNNEQDTDEKERVVVTFKTWNPTDMGADSPIHSIIRDFEEL